MKKYIASIICLLQFIVFTSCQTNAQKATISINDFEKGIAQKDIQLLDVRTADEYKTGHLQNALQANWNNDEEFKERAKSLDKTKPLYVYCLGGSRSNAAMNWLVENGFINVYNMQGGISAWKQANKAVIGVNNVKQIALQEYFVAIPKDKNVLVDFGAEWCPPCKKMKPILDSLEQQQYSVIKIDGAAQTALCKQLNVDAFPVFIVYKNGKEIWRKQGVVEMETLKQQLK
jgi:rhodanese-related sulfurtransferase